MVGSFGVIVPMRLTFSLSRNKWYQSNLVTPYGVWALPCNVGLNEDGRDLSRGDYNT